MEKKFKMFGLIPFTGRVTTTNGGKPTVVVECWGERFYVCPHDIAVSARHAELALESKVYLESVLLLSKWTIAAAIRSAMRQEKLAGW